MTTPEDDAPPPANSEISKPAGDDDYSMEDLFPRPDETRGSLERRFNHALGALIAIGFGKTYTKRRMEALAADALRALAMEGWDGPSGAEELVLTELDVVRKLASRLALHCEIMAGNPWRDACRRIRQAGRHVHVDVQVITTVNGLQSENLLSAILKAVAEAEAMAKAKAVKVEASGEFGE